MTTLRACPVCDTTPVQGSRSASRSVAPKAAAADELAADISAVNRKLAARDRWVTVLERNAATAAVRAGDPLTGPVTMQNVFRFRTTAAAAFTASAQPAPSQT